MKKTLIGLGLMLMAGVLLVKESIPLPDFGIPLWLLIVIVGFGIKSLRDALRQHWTASFTSALIALILLNWQFEWLEVSLFTVIIAAILLIQGFSMIVKPKKSSLLSDKTSMIADTIFKSGTRYVTDDALVDLRGDVVFSSVSIYADHATMLGDQVTYSGDTVFSSVKLYVPKDWQVEFTGDHVFSSVNAPSHHHVTHKTLVVTGDIVFSSFEVIAI